MKPKNRSAYRINRLQLETTRVVIVWSFDTISI